MIEVPKEKKVCPRCFGREVVELETTHYGIPITEPCLCAVARDTYRNLERGWRGITSAPRIPESPLLERISSDLYLTANDPTLRTHLKHIGIKMGRNWSFAVTSDAGLMTAWLASAALKGEKILDFDVAEAASVSLEKFTLLDLVEPPGLLIIRLGVKIAKNIAMADVLLESLTLRDHENKPTWVVDQSFHRLNSGGDPPHRCYSPAVADYLRNWEYLSLNDQEDDTGLRVDMLGEVSDDDDIAPRFGSSSPSFSLSSMQGVQTTGAHAVARPDSGTDPKKSKKPYRRDQ